ncbi:MAG: hypothetical protein H8E55_53045 [Pelagibacterales bacterium]|nr:hypothetical protein [Pelagibacterales bacterium]
MRKRRCLFGTWVTLEEGKDSMSIRHDDFDVEIKLIGEEVTSGLGRLFLIENSELFRYDNSTFHMNGGFEISKKLQDELDRSVHYVVTSTSKEGTFESNHPIHGYESMARKISDLIKKRPKKARGKKINNLIQSAIIDKWYEKKVTDSCCKVIKKPLINMVSGLNFLTTALYRKIKSNLGKVSLEDYFSRMIALRFHCEEFRSDSDFINDFFKCNAVSHMLSSSYLDSSLRVKWGTSNLGDYSSCNIEAVDGWRSLFFTEGVECPNKRYIIDNLPRSIPSHIVHGMCRREYDQKSADRIYILFKSLLGENAERRINKILDSQIFDIDDLKDSLRLFSDFIYRFNGIIKSAKTYKRKKKPSYRKSSVISSFCRTLEKSDILCKCDEIVSSGFCFSSMLDLTKSVCLENMDRMLESSITSTDKSSNDKKDKIRRMKKKFLKEHQDVVNIKEDLNITTCQAPPF